MKSINFTDGVIAAALLAVIGAVAFIAGLGLVAFLVRPAVVATLHQDFGLLELLAAI